MLHNISLSACREKNLSSPISLQKMCLHADHQGHVMVHKKSQPLMGTVSPFIHTMVGSDACGQAGQIRIAALQGFVYHKECMLGGIICYLAASFIHQTLFEVLPLFMEPDLDCPPTLVAGQQRTWCKAPRIAISNSIPVNEVARPSSHETGQPSAIDTGEDNKVLCCSLIFFIARLTHNWITGDEGPDFGPNHYHGEVVRYSCIIASVYPPPFAECLF